MNWTTLVDPTLLVLHLHDPDLRIVDARFVLTDSVAGRAGYQASHLPHAVFADLNEDLADLSKIAQGQGRHPLPDASVFTAKLGQWGIAPQHQVVVYDGGDGSMAAARLWWMLKLLGHAHVAVLDGGSAAWQAAGLPESDEVPVPPSTAAYPGAYDAARIASDDDVAARLQDAPGWLVDARAEERYSGRHEHVDRVAGHVPGAVNRPFLDNLQDGRLRDPQALRDELLPLLGGHAPEDVVLMCGSGVTACHLLLAFEHAGLPGPRIYTGSWSGWISDPARPVAVTS
ncbi:thiosulfate/3-mercaptopyruvate sulfurtransferase [Pseudoxanthomonas sp. GM95]|uniref:sulfurtransferase n=1 Tax=Pseudoxanthomonas sp. GM95 TaxID=1881043 RepID=UPI0008B1B9CA|nr:sulfurtransferase [Pseudoxanthomonas sp. GM95]SEL82376.1 thiosulfate/3-mercaptopyruvate sulfurtransferase [Pseudoxanthomonas sp. GM95]